MGSPTPWDELFRLARRQHGAVHVRQAKALGIPGRTLRSRAPREGWPRPHPGVFLVPGAPETFPAACTAALLATGGTALVGRWAALHLHGLLSTRPTHVDLVVPDGRRAPRLRRVRSWRSGTLLEEDRADVAGVAVTALPRTLMDLAPVTELAYLRDRTLAALQRRLSTPADLRRRLERTPCFPGRGRLRRIVEELEVAQPDSSFEHDVRDYLIRQGFGGDIHPRPFPFRCPDGVVVHLDIAMPRWWLALECDSIRWHTGAEAFDTDRLRWSQIQAGGWRIVWITSRRFRDDPASILAEIERHLAAADPSRPAALPAR